MGERNMGAEIYRNTAVVGKYKDEGRPTVEANTVHEIFRIYLDFAKKIKPCIYKT
tara:strand:+ start:240 stop:404 length:165 start_codon:yes stop_codon:yes gene_type:complete